jgi:hypothetical protein
MRSLGVSRPRKFNRRAFWRRQNNPPFKAHSVIGGNGSLFVVGRPVGAATSKRALLEQARRDTKNPRLTWKGAKKYMKRLERTRSTSDLARILAREATRVRARSFGNWGGILGRSTKRKPKAFGGRK